MDVVSTCFGGWGLWFVVCSLWIMFHIPELRAYVSSNRPSSTQDLYIQASSQSRGGEAGSIRLMAENSSLKHGPWLGGNESFVMYLRGEGLGEEDHGPAATIFWSMKGVDGRRSSAHTSICL